MTTSAARIVYDDLAARRRSLAPVRYAATTPSLTTYICENILLDFTSNCKSDFEEKLSQRGNMAAIIIGRVKSGSGKSHEVKWDQSNKDVYVSYSGWKHIDKASTASEAMNKAEAFLYDK